MSTAPISPYPIVTEALLAEAVERLLTAGDPLQIVLFGSHARGTARADSDLDLLVIEESTLPRYRRPVRYLRALTGLFPVKDVVVWTPAEVRAWAEVPAAFITTSCVVGCAKGTAISPRPAWLPRAVGRMTRPASTPSRRWKSTSRAFSPTQG